MLSADVQIGPRSFNRGYLSFSVIGGIIVVLAIFSRELGRGTLYGIDVDYIAYPMYLIYILCLLLSVKISVDKTVFLAFLYVLGSSILAKVVLGLKLLPLVKQFLPIVLIYGIVSYSINRIGPERLFEWYLKGAFISAIIGLFQFVMKFFNVKVLTVFTGYFVDSVAEEPSHYAAIVLPALVYSFMFWRKHIIEFIVILVAVVLTFNLTAYLVSALMILIIFGRLVWMFFLLPLLYYFGTYVYEVIPNFQLRIDGVIHYLNVKSYKDLHGTPLSFFSNWAVAMETLRMNPLFGSGLGGHEEMYYRYFSTNSFSQLDYLLGLNAKSAHSLSIRVISELGVIGFSLYAYLLSWPLRWREHKTYYAIGLGCLSHFFCKTLKLGNYFDLGTPFFILLIYFIGREIHSRI